MIDLTKLAAQIRMQNHEKGFESPRIDTNKKLLLAISEICEAQDELRDGKDPAVVYYEDISLGPDPTHGDAERFIRKPCGFLVELADAAIRLLDIAGAYDIPVIFNDGVYVVAEDFHEDMLYICNLISQLDPVGLSELTASADKLSESIARIFALAHHIRPMAYYVSETFFYTIEEKLAFNRLRPHKHGRQF